MLETTEGGRFFEYEMIDGLSVDAVSKIEEYFDPYWREYDENYNY